MGLNRRAFVMASAAMLAAPMVKAAGRPRVVIVGGGAGGASVARSLAADSAGAIEVILVEPSRAYTTCFFSNLYLGGLRSMADLSHGYGRLSSALGVTVVHDWAVGVDRTQRRVTLGSGTVLDYDRLVLSPGIDFVPGSVPGWDVSDQTLMPHAYKGGTQAELLRAQVDAMPPGGVFAMIAPPNPYRCPPGPYERVCMVAHRLSQVNPTAKILVIDPKEKFSKQGLFEDGWQRHYPGMIDRIGPDFGARVIEVHPEQMEVVIDGTVERVDVCNVIPAMRAGTICQAAGVTGPNGWVTVEPTALRVPDDPNVHVLGDSAAQGDMPKSAFSANSQARVVAMTIRGELTGSRIFPARYTNTCWSAIAPGDGVKVGAAYEPSEGRIASVSSFVSQMDEDAALRDETWQESFGWYSGITADMFG